MNRPWNRILQVVLSNDVGNSMTIGGAGSNQFSIDVKAEKKMLTAGDTATVRISNLTYATMLKIIEGRYYNIDIYCGYENRGKHRIFTGGVLYMSNERTDNKTNTVIILCASKLIAKFGQMKLNLTMNSGINMYSAVKFIANRAGIRDIALPNEMTNQVVNEYFSIKGTTPQTYLENMTNLYANYGVIPDASTDGTSVTITAFNDSAEKRKIDNANISLSNGYPRLTNSGLVFNVLPTQPYMCGSVIILDNSIIDISASSQSEFEKSYGNFLNSQGEYRIKEVNYSLQNRGSNFSAEIVCMSKSVLGV